MSSHGRDLSKPHKCFTAKCKGTLVDPPNTYGKWAYWWGDGSNGWHNSPKPD